VGGGGSANSIKKWGARKEGLLLKGEMSGGGGMTGEKEPAETFYKKQLGRVVDHPHPGRTKRKITRKGVHSRKANIGC